MTPVAAPGRDSRPRRAEARRGLEWLRRDEGWAPEEGASRLVIAILVALAAVGLKLVVVRGFGGELGYLSYVGAVVLGAWIAGLRGGLVTTGMCAIAEIVLFAESLPASAGLASSELIRVGLFLFDGGLVSLITSRLRRAIYQERLTRAEREAHFEAELAAHEAAEQDRLALQRLQAVTASLASAATPTEVADAILDRGLTALAADAGGVSRINLDGSELTVIASRGYPPDETRPGTIFRLDRPSHLSDAVRGAKPVFIGNAIDWTSRYPASPPYPLPGSPTGGAIAILPLVSAGRVLGSVVFRFAAERDFSDGTGDLAVRLADQGAQALDRALAYDREQSARRALERGQERLRFLASASDRLGARIDIRSTLTEVAQLAVPTVADWCAIELLDLDAPIRGVAAADTRAVEIVERLAVVAPRSLGLWLSPDTGDDGDGIVTIDAGWSKRLGDPRAIEAMTELGTTSCLVAPIPAELGAPMGSIVLGAAGVDRFEADDLALVRDLAGRIGVAAAQTRLFGAVDRFKATVDVTADAVYMFDPRTLRLTYVNRGGADLIGREPDVLLGTSVLGLQPKSAAETFLNRLNGLRSVPTSSTTFTGVLVRGDDREIPVEAFLQEITLPDGGATAILTARDVTERIDVQARLTRIAGDERRQAAELRAVIQAMGEGILVVDPSGHITLANDAAAEILGELPAKLADLAPALGDRSLESQSTVRDRAMPSDEARQTVALSDGRWVEIATYPADLGGRLIEGSASSTIVVVRDVTRVRQAEAAREAFLGVLSHELRTPVTTIFGYAKVLQRPSRREDRDEMLADIEVEADRLYRIVEDLLALSRVEGGMTIEGEPLLLQHLAGPVVASEAQRWTGIEFETDLPAGLPAVFGERTYVEQVLRNLVSNAGKYSPPDTVVTIAASVTPTEVEIRVLDRGAGIISDEADRLFDLYYRSPTTARTAAGAGIGLYVGRGLITAMGGRIWAQPRDGGGSEFGFSLPRCDEDTVTPPEEPGHSTEDAVPTSVDAAP